jgi:ankyrin repeat protein
LDAAVLGWTDVHEAVVKLLLDTGSEVEIESRGGWTALQLAALNGHEGIEQLLVIYGSSEPEDFYGLQQLFLVL